MKPILILTIFFTCMVCHADKYKKVESQVAKYEKIAKELAECANNIKQDEYYHHLKHEYNYAYDRFVDVGYMLEEIIIIDGGLTIDNLIVPFNDRRESINEIGKRKSKASVRQLIKDIDKNLETISAYTKKTGAYYEEKKQNR